MWNFYREKLVVKNCENVHNFKTVEQNTEIIHWMLLLLLVASCEIFQNCDLTGLWVYV